MSGHHQSDSALGRIVDEIEETAIAIILGLMLMITFINVVLRYGFNTGLIWGAGDDLVPVRLAGVAGGQLCGQGDREPGRRRGHQHDSERARRCWR